MRVWLAITACSRLRICVTTSELASAWQWQGVCGNCLGQLHSRQRDSPTMARQPVPSNRNKTLGGAGGGLRPERTTHQVTEQHATWLATPRRVSYLVCILKGVEAVPGAYSMVSVQLMADKGRR